MKKIYLRVLPVLLLILCVSNNAQAKLLVVTTTPDLRSIVSEIGGDLVSVDAIAKGTQDPHYIEAKPSFMTKVSHADLLISLGLDLEVGWLPSIVSGSRNPKVAAGSKGYFEIGSLLDPIEIPSGKVTRAEGDVHPFGNPHVNLDPIRMGKAAVLIAERMGELDTTNASKFLEKAKAFQSRMEEKTKDWSARIEKTGIKKIITYHKTLNYFFDRFHIENPIQLEPKPGIPPTSSHILEVIQTCKEQKISLILVENFFDATITARIKQDIPTIRSETVPVAVDGESNIHTLDDLYENLVNVIEGAKK